MLSAKKKLTFGVIGTIAIIIIAFYFRSGTGTNCFYIPLTTGLNSYSDTLRVMNTNTNIFFGCKGDNSDHILYDDELPPSGNCNVRQGTTQFEFPGRCNRLSGECPPPYCLVGLMESLVVDKNDSKIVITNPTGGDLYEMSASAIRGNNTYFRFPFDKKRLQSYKGFIIKLYKDGNTFSRAEAFPQ